MPLSRDVLVRQVRAALRPSGMDMFHYSGNRFRAGAATRALSIGIEDTIIKKLNKWERSAYLHYIRIPRLSLTAVARQIVSQVSNDLSDNGESIRDNVR